MIKIRRASIILCAPLLLLAAACAAPAVQDNATALTSPAGGSALSEDEAMAVLTSGGDYDIAIERAREALEAAPSDALREKLADAYMARAWFYKAKRLTTYALKDLLKAKEAAPDYYLVYYDLGRFYNNQVMQSAGIWELEKCIELRPDFAPAYNEKSACESRIFRWEEALVDASKAIELDPGEALYYYTRSLAYKGLGKTAEAVADLETTIRLSQDPTLTEKAGADIQKLRQ